MGIQVSDFLKRLFAVTQRIVIFFLLLQLALFTLYLAGSRNRFLDSSLFAILNLNTAVSIVLIVFSGCALVQLALVLAVTRQLGYLRRLCLLVPSLASAAALAFATRALTRLASG
jgi:hypothetical protein